VLRSSSSLELRRLPFEPFFPVVSRPLAELEFDAIPRFAGSLSVLFCPCPSSPSLDVFSRVHSSFGLVRACFFCRPSERVFLGFFGVTDSPPALDPFQIP